MSDTIQALNEVVFKAGERQDTSAHSPDDPGHLDAMTANHKLLSEIAEIAGDCLEDHVKATDRRKPRKQRVYKEIVRQIAAYFCDQCDTTEGAYHTEEGVREVLAAFDITTVDYTGREVKIV